MYFKLDTLRNSAENVSLNLASKEFHANSTFQNLITNNFFLFLKLGVTNMGKTLESLPRL